jgi:hypothetical protein
MNPFRRFVRKPIGFPLGQHVPADPADHAEDFAHRYGGLLDWQAAIRMEELGVPSDRIGSNDHDHGLVLAAFNPFERDGGGVSPSGQINLDSGSLNPDLMTQKYGKPVGRLWAGLPLADRWDALIAHEDAEWRTGSHQGALDAAPDTEFQISARARAFLIEMKKGRMGR